MGALPKPDGLDFLSTAGLGMVTGGIAPAAMYAARNAGKLLDKIFPTPKMPDLPGAPAPAPDSTDEAVAKAKELERQRVGGARGIKSTFLTGPRGLSGPTPTMPKTLLGQ